MQCIVDKVNIGRPLFGKCTAGGIRDIVLDLTKNNIDLDYPEIVNCTSKWSVFQSDIIVTVTGQECLVSLSIKQSSFQNVVV